MNLKQLLEATSQVDKPAPKPTKMVAREKYFGLDQEKALALLREAEKHIEAQIKAYPWQSRFSWYAEKFDRETKKYVEFLKDQKTDLEISYSPERPYSETGPYRCLGDGEGIEFSISR